MENTKTFPILGRLGELKMTASEFGARMGICRTRCHLLVNGERDFKASEIKKACEILGIKSEDIPKYFFDNSTSKKEERANDIFGNGSREREEAFENA